jgi:hypothetical protein
MGEKQTFSNRREISKFAESLGFRVEFHSLSVKHQSHQITSAVFHTDGDVPFCNILCVREKGGSLSLSHVGHSNLSDKLKHEASESVREPEL